MVTQDTGWKEQKSLVQADCTVPSGRVHIDRTVMLELALDFVDLVGATTSWTEDDPAAADAGEASALIMKLPRCACELCKWKAGDPSAFVGLDVVPSRPTLS